MTRCPLMSGGAAGYPSRTPAAQSGRFPWRWIFYCCDVPGARVNGPELWQRRSRPRLGRRPGCRRPWSAYRARPVATRIRSAVAMVAVTEACRSSEPAPHSTMRMASRAVRNSIWWLCT